MGKQKNIQMSMAFVTKVYLLIIKLDDYELDHDIGSLCMFIKSQIDDKIDALNRREAFSKYKSAPPASHERDVLRRQYLDLAGIHNDWISSNEFTQ